MADPQYGEQLFAAEFEAMLDSGIAAIPDDPEGAAGPVFIGEVDIYDNYSAPMSVVDALEWELWAGVEQDESERYLLEQKAPAWVFLPPGPELVAALAQVRPQTLSPIELIEFVKASARVTAWSESMRMAGMASFYRQRKAQAAELPRPSEIDSRGRPIDPERSWIAELACALKVSAWTAGAQVDTALRLTGVLSATHSALRCGAISLSKAIAISDATRTLDDPRTRAVEASVLKRASSQSQANLQKSLRRQVARFAAEDETERHRQATTKREVRLVPLEDGMAGLWIVDDADKVQRMWIVIQAMAKLAKRGACANTNVAGSDAAGDASQAAGADSSDVVGSDSDADIDQAGVGEAGNDHAGSGDAGVAETCNSGSDSDVGGAEADNSDSGSEAAVTAHGTAGRQRDEEPGDEQAGDERAGQECSPDRRTADQRRADVVAGLFDFMLWNGLDWLGRRLPDQHRRRPHIEVLTPITTLLGMDDEPCELTGYGPIPADMARRIAADGTWRRILTHPANGTVLEASTTRHDPGAVVSETLLAAHPVCDWINCNRAARECDRDHGIPFAQTGVTKLADLRNYCELHHIIKDTPAWRWTATNNPDGSTTITTPTGHRYTTPPATPGPIARSTSPTTTRPDDPPPF